MDSACLNMLKWVLVLCWSAVLAGESTKNMHAPCRILINEVSFSIPAFLEISKICPDSAGEKNSYTGLAGYGLVIIDASSLELKFHKSLDRVKLNALGTSEPLKTSKSSSLPTLASSHNDDDSARTAASKGAPNANINGLSVSKASASSSPSLSRASNPTTTNGAKFTEGLPEGNVNKGSKSTSTNPSSSSSPAAGTTESIQPSNTAASQKGPRTTALHPKPPSSTFPAADLGKLAAQAIHPVSKGSGVALSLPATSSGAMPQFSAAPQRNGLASSLPAKTPPTTFDQSRGESQQLMNTATSKVQTLYVTDINDRKGEKISVTPTKDAASSCSSLSCSPASKKPRRSKREIQFLQQNLWALKDIDLGAISLDESKTYVVALIYLPLCKRTSLWDRYRVGTILSEEVQNELKQYSYDLLILTGTQECDISNATKILPEGADLTYIEPASELHSYSFSKCDKGMSPFNPEGFIHSERTKGSPNLCPVYEEPDPFSFRGTNLKIQTQKIVVNVVTNLRKKMSDESWRKLSPVEAAASILNLSRVTIYRIMGKYENGVEFTEGKKQCRRRPVTTLEPEWQTLLYKTITGEYEQNRVARVAYVLKAFVQAVRTQQLQELEKRVTAGTAATETVQRADISTGPTESESTQSQDGETIVDFEDERHAPELYHCSARSFTKILDRYGYKYGKIRNRDSQIFRPVNLKWREMYLTAIDKYDTDPAWNVVYLDETWVDPHQRANRGIVLKKYENFQQRKDFTFKDDKISRGSRLIILAAGGADGFIHEATEIYAVSVNAKKKSADSNSDCSSSVLPQDYHDNVKGPKFMQWLEKLFKLLERKKTVFVMDNCPFHKVLGIPKTSDKKEVIRQWLEEKKAEGHEINEDVSPTTKLTKMALLGIVGRLTTDDPSAETKIPRTQVQQLARQYGHRVLLLPPYNCDLNPIEYVWNDIKREVKEKNTDQTVSLAMDLANRAISVYPKEGWQAHIGHTIKLRAQYREGDKVFSTMQATLDSDEAMAEELSDADYSAIDKEATPENESCVYEDPE